MTQGAKNLSLGEIPFLAESWALFALLDISIRFRGYASWRHWLDERNPSAGTRLTSQEIDRLLSLSERVARHHWAPMNCLRRSLVQKRLLAARGVDTELHIGVRFTQEKSLKAHAWLSSEGRVLNDTLENIASYRPLEPDHWDSLPRFNQD